jgi:F0F1-type ATP synthase alpha subunit
MIETEKYSNIFYHMERKSLNIVRKTIFKKIEKNVFQYIKDNQSDIIKKVKNDPDYADFITEQIEQIIEQSPPRVIANIDEYHEELKDSVVQAWGAAQGIYKFRRS